MRQIPLSITVLMAEEKSNKKQEKILTNCLSFYQLHIIIYQKKLQFYCYLCLSLNIQSLL